MKKIVCLFALMSASMMMSVTSHAEGGSINANNVYLGGGLGFNSLPGFGNARGIQFFGGYDFDFKLNEDISTAIELGYMSSGDFDAFNREQQGQIMMHWFVRTQLEIRDSSDVLQSPSSAAWDPYQQFVFNS